MTEARGRRAEDRAGFVTRNSSVLSAVVIVLLAVAGYLAISHATTTASNADDATKASTAALTDFQSTIYTRCQGQLEAKQVNKDALADANDGWRGVEDGFAALRALFAAQPQPTSEHDQEINRQFLAILRDVETSAHRAAVGMRKAYDATVIQPCEPLKEQSR